MNKFLITGVSSGIGRALTKNLIAMNYFVWGIARREDALKQLKKQVGSRKFTFSVMDQASDKHWIALIKRLKKRGFIPNVIIFNAAVQKLDLDENIDINNLKHTLNVNFLGIMKGIQSLLPLIKAGSQIVAISSFSAFKGSRVEGVGYAASKAALSIGFESLHQYFKKKGILFKTIFFGPINSGMGPFKKAPFIISEKKAVQFIIKSLYGKQGQYYYPKTIFFVMKLIKLLPSSIYFKILSMMEYLHQKLQKNAN